MPVKTITVLHSTTITLVTSEATLLKCEVTYNWLGGRYRLFFLLVETVVSTRRLRYFTDDQLLIDVVFCPGVDRHVSTLQIQDTSQARVQTGWAAGEYMKHHRPGYTDRLSTLGIHKTSQAWVHRQVEHPGNTQNITGPGTHTGWAPWQYTKHHRPGYTGWALRECMAHHRPGYTDRLITLEIHKTSQARVQGQAEHPWNTRHLTDPGTQRVRILRRFEDFCIY